MALKPTMVQLPEELVALLDARAHAQGVSRSQVVRDAVAAYLRRDADARLAERYEAAYRRYPLDTPDEWGDLESWSRGVERARATVDEDEELW